MGIKCRDGLVDTPRTDDAEHVHMTSASIEMEGATIIQLPRLDSAISCGLHRAFGITGWWD